MTLEEARRLKGQAVEFRASKSSRPERGTITSIGDRYVYVRYGRDTTPQATHPSLLSPVGVPAEVTT